MNHTIYRQIFSALQGLLLRLKVTMESFGVIGFEQNKKIKYTDSSPKERIDCNVA